MSPAPLLLPKYLMLLGYGTRRDVEPLFELGRVTRDGGAALRASDTLAAAPHDVIRVDGLPLDAPPGSVFLLHKPAGLVCSTSDAAPLVYERLPPRLRLRSPVVAPVGRLDKDTTGLLLLTDDGPLLHRLTSPKSHLPKTYRATLASPLHGDEAERFAAGTLMLNGERTPIRPASLERLGEREVRLVITEGRYHQVRRMFAAVGNLVVSLHREAIGPITLGSLAEGEWRLLSAVERVQLDEAVREARAAQR